MQTLILLAFVALMGAIIENVDRYAGAGLRHMLGWSPATSNQGFIAGRDAQQRTIWMAVIFGAWIVLKIIFSEVSFITVLWGIVVIPVLVIGSFAGPWLGAVWGRRDSLFKAVDEFQKDPTSIFDGIAAWWNRLTSPVIITPPPAPAAATETTAKPAEDPLATASRPPVVNGHDSSAPPAPAPAPDDHKKDFKDYVNQ